MGVQASQNQSFIQRWANDPDGYLVAFCHPMERAMKVIQVIQSASSYDFADRKHQVYVLPPSSDVSKSMDMFRRSKINKKDHPSNPKDLEDLEVPFQ